MTATTTIAPALGGDYAGRTFSAVDELEDALRGERYISERGLATTLYLTLRLRKPLLLEGEAGVGKTEIAKTLSAILDTPLIRLQCYEGLDASSAIYEWDYPRQMLYLRTIEATGGVDAEALRRRLGGFHRGAVEGRRDVEAEIAERTTETNAPQTLNARDAETSGGTVEEASS